MSCDGFEVAEARLAGAIGAHCTCDSLPIIHTCTLAIAYFVIWYINYQTTTIEDDYDSDDMLQFILSLIVPVKSIDVKYQDQKKVLPTTFKLVV